MSVEVGSKGRPGGDWAGRRVAITGSGYSVPDRVVTNKDLEAQMNTTDAFISTRTGVRERRHAAPESTLCDLMVPACAAALRGAALSAADLDMLIVNTLSPDYHDPSQACLLQERLGLRHVPAFDIRAQCSGSLYALDVAAQFIATGRCQHVMVVCGELLSKRLDRSDEGRNVSVLLGDGAGALVVSGVGAEGPRLVDIATGADGSRFRLLFTAAPGSANRTFLDEGAVKEGRHFFRMQGRAMFEHAVATLVGAAREMLAGHRLTIADLDSVLVHQPNLSILREVGRQLEVPAEKLPTNVERFGNMASASLPVTIAQAFEAGRMRAGGLHLFLTYGSGATWGAALYRS
jgi:3-oxoacyl-(acyl-carrier-protein) synthase III